MRIVIINMVPTVIKKRQIIFITTSVVSSYNINISKLSLRGHSQISHFTIKSTDNGHLSDRFRLSEKRGKKILKKVSAPQAKKNVRFFCFFLENNISYVIICVSFVLWCLVVISGGFKKWQSLSLKSAKILCRLFFFGKKKKMQVF